MSDFPRPRGSNHEKDSRRSSVPGPRLSLSSSESTTKDDGHPLDLQRSAEISPGEHRRLHSVLSPAGDQGVNDSSSNSQQHMILGRPPQIHGRDPPGVAKAAAMEAAGEEMMAMKNPRRRRSNGDLDINDSKDSQDFIDAVAETAANDQVDGHQGRKSNHQSDMTMRSEKKDKQRSNHVAAKVMPPHPPFYSKTASDPKKEKSNDESDTVSKSFMVSDRTAQLQHETMGLERLDALNAPPESFSPVTSGSVNIMTTSSTLSGGGNTSLHQPGAFRAGGRRRQEDEAEDVSCSSSSDMPGDQSGPLGPAPTLSEPDTHLVSAFLVTPENENDYEGGSRRDRRWSLLRRSTRVLAHAEPLNLYDGDTHRIRPIYLAVCLLAVVIMGLTVSLSVTLTHRSSAPSNSNTSNQTINGTTPKVTLPPFDNNTWQATHVLIWGRATTCKSWADQQLNSSHGHEVLHGAAVVSITCGLYAQALDSRFAVCEQIALDKVICSINVTNAHYNKSLHNFTSQGASPKQEASVLFACYGLTDSDLTARVELAEAEVGQCAQEIVSEQPSELLPFIRTYYGGLATTYVTLARFCRPQLTSTPQSWQVVNLPSTCQEGYLWFVGPSLITGLIESGIPFFNMTANTTKPPLVPPYVNASAAIIMRADANGTLGVLDVTKLQAFCFRQSSCNTVLSCPPPGISFIQEACVGVQSCDLALDRLVITGTHDDAGCRARPSVMNDNARLWQMVSNQLNFSSRFVADFCFGRYRFSAPTVCAKFLQPV